MFQKIAIALIPLLALTACGAPSESDLTDAFEAEFAKVPAPFKPKLLDLDLIGCNSQGEAYVCDVTTRVMPPFMTSEISKTGAVRVIDANGTWVLAGGI
jgi:hypothetical protein